MTNISKVIMEIVLTEKAMHAYPIWISFWNDGSLVIRHIMRKYLSYYEVSVRCYNKNETLNVNFFTILSYLLVQIARNHAHTKNFQIEYGSMKPP